MIAKRLGSGLQNRLDRFDSDSRLHFLCLFPKCGAILLCRSAPCSTRRSGRIHQYALSRRSFSRRRIPSLLACKTRPAVRYRTLNSWHCACRPARLPDRRDAGIKKQGILLPAVYRPVKLFDLFRHQQRHIPRPATVQPECLGSLPQQLRQFTNPVLSATLLNSSSGLRPPCRIPICTKSD